MGYYVQTPGAATKGKAEELIRTAGATEFKELMPWDEIPADHHLVVVLENSQFDAALILHDKQAYDAYVEEVAYEKDEAEKRIAREFPSGELGKFPENVQDAVWKAVFRPRRLLLIANEKIAQFLPKPTTAE